jgi:hypothetical protein
MTHQFDELAKALAEDLSRREALRRIGGAVAGALLVSLGLGRAWGQSGAVDCGRWCTQRLPLGKARGRCASTCESCQASGGTPCTTGAQGGVICCTGGATSVCCGGACVDTTSDPKNCGGCAGAGGTVCDATKEHCVSGKCAPTCKSLGQTCSSTEECCNGSCNGSPKTCCLGANMRCTYDSDCCSPPRCNYGYCES